MHLMSKNVHFLLLSSSDIPFWSNISKHKEEKWIINEIIIKKKKRRKFPDDFILKNRIVCVCLLTDFINYQWNRMNKWQNFKLKNK
jgi:hypothetical protein